MLSKRIIPCLDVTAGRVVKGVSFVELRDAGDPVEIARRYDELGHDAVMKLFPQVTPDEHTHPNRAGAELNASFVIGGLKALQEDPVAPYFSEKAKGVAVVTLGSR